MTPRFHSRPARFPTGFARIPAVAYMVGCHERNPRRGIRPVARLSAVEGVLSPVAVPPTPTEGIHVITFSLLVIFGIIGGVLALVDGIWRLRARGGSTIVGVIEIIVAALFILSFFVPIPWGSWCSASPPSSHWSSPCSLAVAPAEGSRSPRSW